MSSLPSQSVSNKAVGLDPDAIMREPARIIDDFYTIDGQDLVPLTRSGYSGWLTNFILDARIIALRRSAQKHIHLFTCDLPTLIEESKDFSTLHEGIGLAIFTRNPEYKILKSPSPPPLDLGAKSLWVFPIHRVNHWLFGAVDFARKRLLFMDPFGAVDDGQSVGWAFALLRNIVNHLRFSLELGPINFKTWELVNLCPTFPQEDTNSCGIYVLKAIELISAGQDPADIPAFEPLEARAEILSAILNEPVHIPASLSMRSDISHGVCLQSTTPTSQDLKLHPKTAKPIVSLSEDDCVSDDVYEDTSKPVTGPYLTRSASDSCVLSESKALLSTKARQGPNIHRSHSEADLGLQRHEKSPSPPAIHSQRSEGGSSRRQRNNPRRKNESNDQKIAMLDADPNVLRYGPRMITCRCQPHKPIHLPHDYNLQNWQKHTGRCKLRSLEQRGFRTLDQFFTTPASTPSPKHSKAVLASSSPQPSLLNTVLGRLKLSSCCGLNEEPYLSLAETQPDDHYGGVSPAQYPEIYRRIFPWKDWPKSEQPRPEVPAFGNRDVRQQDFTEEEMEMVNEELRSLSIWKVDGSVIRSTTCSGRTANRSQRCDACATLLRNKSLRKVAKKAEARCSLPPDQRDLELARITKHTNNIVSGVRKHRFLKQLSDLENGGLLRSLEDDSAPGGIFVKLAFLARKRKFRLPEQVEGMVTMLVDKWERSKDPRGKMKHGIRYPPALIHLSILLQTGGSSQNYNIFQELCGMPVFRHVLKLKAAIGEGLHAPNLCLENLQGAKRLIAMWNWHGPLALQTDCTKLDPDIAFVTDFAHKEGLFGHIVGSTFPLTESEVWNAKQIMAVIDRIKKEGKTKAFATYMRVTALNIPWPGAPAIVIAAYATANNETGKQIADHILEAQKLCEDVGIALLSFGADGAKAERLGQRTVRDSTSLDKRLTYINPVYGIHIYAPIFKTGPAVAVQDVGHVQKTARNNEMSGTHLIVMGIATISFTLLVELYLHSVGYAETAIKDGRPPARALKTRDIFKVDKQDDGAARRFFHALTLLLMTHIPDGNESSDYVVLDRFQALFAMHFVLGELFDAWLNRRMSHFERLRIALRAKLFLLIIQDDLRLKCEAHHDIFNLRQSFISYESREIIETLCDGLILLILAHTEFYPDIPLCPWEHGTESIEHLFGVARQVLGKFKYAEFIKHIKAVIIRQGLLASGKYNAAKRSRSASGYLFDNAHRKLTDEDIEVLRTFPTRSEFDSTCQVAWDEAAAICRSLLKIPPPTLPLRPDLVSQAFSNSSEDSDNQREDAELISGAVESLVEEGVNASQETNSAAYVADDGDDTQAILSASRITAKLHALDQDLDAARKDAEDAETVDPNPEETLNLALPPRPVVRPHLHNLLGRSSDILAPDGTTLLVPKMVASRFETQSSSGVRSETILSLRDSLQTHLRMLEDTAFSSDAPTLPVGNAGSSRLQTASSSTKPLSCNDMASLARYLMKEVGELLPVRRKDRELFWTGAPTETECPAVYDIAEELVDATNLSKALKVASSKPEVWSLFTKITATVQPPLQVPNLNVRNVSPECPLKTGSFVIAHTGSRVVIGEVLACYVKASGRHGWRGQVDTTEGLSYLSLKVFVHAFQLDEKKNMFVHTVPHPQDDAYSWNLFAHLPKAKLIYHLPTATMEFSEAFGCYLLDAVSHLIWRQLMNPSFCGVLSAFKDRRLPEETVIQPTFQPSEPLRPDAAVAPKKTGKRAAAPATGGQPPPKRASMKDLRQATLFDILGNGRESGRK